VREDTLDTGGAFSIVQYTVDLRADMRAEAATNLPFAKEKHRLNGKTGTLGSVYLKGFG